MSSKCRRKSLQAEHGALQGADQLDVEHREHREQQHATSAGLPEELPRGNDAERDEIKVRRVGRVSAVQGRRDHVHRRLRSRQSRALSANDAGTLRQQSDS